MADVATLAYDDVPPGATLKHAMTIRGEHVLIMNNQLRSQLRDWLCAVPQEGDWGLA